MEGLRRMSAEEDLMTLDRIAPTFRESCVERKIGRQTWKDLLFLHWEVPIDRLRPLVPAELAIDEFEGRAYLGLVPFAMHEVSLGPLTVSDFLETNLRTYVHSGGVPGVWFFSLDAESGLAVWGGRTVYRLPYFRSSITSARTRASYHYRLTRDAAPSAELDVEWTFAERARHTAKPESLEFFLTERYALYGPTRGGGIYRLRVHHRSWPLYAAQVARFSTTLPHAAGLEVGDPIDLVLASPEGVEVETFAREAI
jgi:uncharacterized protein YqjF (DUF2071 family)